MAYSDKVLDHYNNPRNVGAFDKEADDVGTGTIHHIAININNVICHTWVVARRIEGNNVQICKYANENCYPFFCISSLYLYILMPKSWSVHLHICTFAHLHNCTSYSPK